MKTTIDKSLIADPALGPVVNEADNLLISIAGSSSSWLSSRWTLQEDSQNHQVVVLTINDFTGSVTADFAPEELTRPYHLYSRLQQLWGKLLQVRVEKQRKLVDESIAASAVGA